MRTDPLAIRAKRDFGITPRPAAPPAPALPAGARKAALPLRLSPQLATLVERLPPGEADWFYEVKLDGYRLLARIDRGRVRLLTRNGLDWTAKLRPLADALATLKLDNGWIDGELVVLDEQGRSDFQRLQRAFDEQRIDDLVFVAFDLPYANGHDLTQVPLRERRALLQRHLPKRLAPHVRFSDAVGGTLEQLLEAACRLLLEGLIAKRADAPYVQGRTRSWLKLKCQPRQEFVVVGFTEPKGSRRGVGALLLAVHDAGGTLRYAGRTGSGFDSARLLSLRQALDAIELEQPPLADPPRTGEAVHWVQPKLVAEVAFAQWTADGLLRQAVFKALRDDKPAREITTETPADVAVAPPPSAAPALLHGVRISSPTRVVDAQSGVTKLQLAQYYDSVLPLILPQLDGRPVALVRAPEGVGGELFFQKHLQRLVIPNIKQLDTALDPGHAPLIEIDSAAALIGAVQMGTLEFHTWNALHSAIEKPDRLVFDLDPDPALPWARVVEAAELLKNLLDELGLASFVKTSGGRGLHVVLPLKRRQGWDEVKSFAQGVAQRLASVMPERFSAKMGAANRVGKVFVDYLRNSRGATAVCAYSARARPGLPVSVPIAWDELVTLSSGAQWTVQTLPQRTADLAGHEPWAGYEDARQGLGTAARHLARSQERQLPSRRTG